jgi:membrane protease YdiL (CAAX protease family)
VSPVRVTEWLRRRRTETLLVVATVALAAFYYGTRADVIGVRSAAGDWTAMTGPAWPATAHYLASLVLLALLPLGAACWLFRESPAAFGLGAGRWREGLVWLAVGIPLVLLAGRVGAGSEAMRAVYPLDRGLGPEPHRFLPGAAMEFLYYGSWEVLFRGVILFGLRGAIGGGNANVVQTALSVLAHFGRAPDETFAAIPAGLLFGWVNLRVGSIWYVAVLHWLVGASMDWFIVS